MTNATIAETAFAGFVRGHLGDFHPDAVDFIRAYVGSIDHDREALRQVLRRQIPAFEVVASLADGGRLLPTPDSEGESVPLPSAGVQMHQVMPAYGSRRIGHVLRQGCGWAAFHHREPNQACVVGVPQLDAVIGVFVEHFASL